MDNKDAQKKDMIQVYSVEKGSMVDVPKMNKTEEEWKKELKGLQYDVTRNKGTERPFTGELLKNKKKGVYTCGVCGMDLFLSDDKYDSGTGWPSFSKPVHDQNVAMKEDSSHSMQRTEVVCPRCGAHLGHVFDDGPTETGKRFCINSASLKFKAKEGDAQSKE